MVYSPFLYCICIITQRACLSSPIFEIIFFPSLKLAVAHNIGEKDNLNAKHNREAHAVFLDSGYELNGQQDSNYDDSDCHFDFTPLF